MTTQENMYIDDEIIRGMAKTCEKYNKALDRAKEELRVCGSQDCDAARQIFRFFPELKETNGEQIRKRLIKAFGSMVKEQWGGIAIEDILAWLEKQKSNTNKKEIDDAYLQGICDAKHEIEKQSESTITNIEIPFGANDSELQEVSYYIPEGFYAEIKDDRVVIKKAEQKFKVGDWVITNLGNIYQIKSASEITAEHIFGYTVVGGGYFNDNNNGVRLWTINDAKDGDVLVNSAGQPFIFSGKYDDTYFGNPIAYCGVNCQNKFKIGNGTHWTSKNEVAPATKEQRELLFQKMKESGYEWDTEKKELRKIDTYQLNENPCSGCTNTKGCITCVNGDQKSTSTPRMLYSDEVIEWLDDNICNAYDYDGNEITTTLKSKFKQDFGL